MNISHYCDLQRWKCSQKLPVASLGEGANRPGWYPPGGDIRRKEKMWLNLQRTVDKRSRSDR